MVRGRLDEKATTATGYAWLVWKKTEHNSSKVVWIPPCRRELEKPDDYSSLEVSISSADLQGVTHGKKQAWYSSGT
jgi:hypothetical protein